MNVEISSQQNKNIFFVLFVCLFVFVFACTTTMWAETVPNFRSLPKLTSLGVDLPDLTLACLEAAKLAGSAVRGLVRMRKQNKTELMYWSKQHDSSKSNNDFCTEADLLVQTMVSRLWLEISFHLLMCVNPMHSNFPLDRILVALEMEQSAPDRRGRSGNGDQNLRFRSLSLAEA
jgi:hypothetical protein